MDYQEAYFSLIAGIVSFFLYHSNNYTPLVSSYTSLFEVAVALNVAFAASKQVRKVFLDLFRTSVLSTEQRLTKDIEETRSMLSVMNESLDESKKENILNKLETNLSNLKKTSNTFKKKLFESTIKISEETRPVYILVAIINIFYLFLAGQESVHQMFPGNEMFFITAISFMSIAVLIATTTRKIKFFLLLITIPILFLIVGEYLRWIVMSKLTVSILYILIITIVINSINIAKKFIFIGTIILIVLSFNEVFPIYTQLELSDYNKLIVDAAIFLSFSPIMISFLRILIVYKTINKEFENSAYADHSSSSEIIINIHNLSQSQNFLTKLEA
jgi:hypothetical protein